MFVRALIAFLVLPGVVAFAAPLLLLVLSSHLRMIHPAGLVLLGAGIAGLLACVRDFYVAGKGTLAPWAPPQRLVVVGLYRWSRNPMYVCVVMILLGWAWSFGSLLLLLYAAGIFAAFHLRVVRAEEPFLERTHGQDWLAYRARVPRWLGRTS